MIRNVFDQYDQPENKLTHALMVTLANDRKLIRPFLKKLGVENAPSLGKILLGMQCSPGLEAQDERADQEGLPDGCFYSEDGWAVILEAKVQARASVNQVKRHIKSARRYGYEHPEVMLIGVDGRGRLPDWIRYAEWKDVCTWFNSKAEQSVWARRFAEYMRIFESKMLAADYEIRGTLTMFDGFRFCDSEPYTYAEGKRLIRLLGDEMRKHKRLVKSLGIDRVASGRGAITRGRDGGVWDFLPMMAGRGRQFISTLHPTLVIRPEESGVSLTIPNGMKGLKKSLVHSGIEGFGNMISAVDKNLRPILSKTPSCRPMLYILQRHYRSQRSIPTIDGSFEVDIRAIVGDGSSQVRYQPFWLESAYNLLTNKKSNLQWGIELHIPHTEKLMQTKKAVEHMANGLIAMKPLADYVL